MAEFLSPIRSNELLRCTIPLGVINSQGKVVIPALYHQIEQLSEVLFAAEFSWEYDNYKGIWTTIRIDD